MTTVPGFVLPTTAPWSLVQALGCSPVDRPTVVAADSARNLARDALKIAKHSDEPDFVAVAKALETYMDKLFVLLDDPARFQPSTPLPPTSWRVPLRSSLLNSEAPHVQFAHVDFERVMVALTYALCLLRLADAIVARPETSDSSDVKERRWKQANAHLTKAVAVLEYIRVHSFHPADGDVRQLALDSTVTTFSDIAASALHMVVLLKTLETETEDHEAGFSMQTSPASYSLMSRVAMYAVERLTSAASQWSQSSAKKSLVDTDPTQKWLTDARRFSLAFAHKSTASEQANRDLTGKAIAHLYVADQLLKAGSTKSLKSRFTPSVSLASKRDGFPDIQTASHNLRVLVDALLNKYRAQNDRYELQTVPDPSDVEKELPSGRNVIPASGPWSPRGDSPSSVQQGYY